ncbi:MAG: hypothetical protein ACOC1G_00920 [Phycisphaeraceae bacterium]
MATWTVSDELDARLRKKVGERDVASYVETLLTDQLNCEEDADYRNEVQAQLDASEADIAAGRVTEARDAMRRIAHQHGVDFDR